jgi:hypothetical protein
MKVLGVSFGDEGDIEVTWVDTRESDRFGAEIRTTMITSSGVAQDEQVGYYASEVQDDLEELLRNWQRWRRDN